MIISTPSQTRSVCPIRYSVRHPETLAELTDVLCSSIGSLTNVSKLTKTLRSIKGSGYTEETIGSYLGYLSDAFLFRAARRYDVKGKKYFEYPVKYYCEDIGLRNVRLNLRQQEETHIMENMIFNELISRGYSVDVGVIQQTETGEDGKRRQKSCEIDFIVNAGNRKYYIQSALSLPTPEKRKQEIRPLLAVKDFFQKIIISKTAMKPWIDEFGIRHIGLCDFPVNAGDFVKLAAGASIKPGRSYLTYTGTGNPWASTNAPKHRVGTDLPQSISVVLVNSDGSTTEIGTLTPVQPDGEGVWFSLDGRKLDGKPTAKGMYIHNGVKVVVK